jgi:hypothetical protein
MRHLVSVSLVVSSFLLLTACNKPAEQAPLPPAGLAGGAGAGAHGGAGGVGLPGAGSVITNPAGGGASLPSGHPPIGGVPPGTPTGMPMDHSNQPTAPGGAMALPGGGSMGTEPSGIVQIVGTVTEALNVPEYTYMRVKVAAGADEWVAVPRANIAVGDKVTVTQSIVMNNFPSKSLNRSFDKLTMGVLVGAPQKAN